MAFAGTTDGNMQIKLIPPEIHYNVIKICTLCQGDGYQRGETIPCYNCKGLGIITQGYTRMKKL